MNSVLKLNPKLNIQVLLNFESEKGFYLSDIVILLFLFEESFNLFSLIIIYDSGDFLSEVNSLDSHILISELYYYKTDLLLSF